MILLGSKKEFSDITDILVNVLINMTSHTSVYVPANILLIDVSKMMLPNIVIKGTRLS